MTRDSLEALLANTLLYGSVIAVLLFFYIPIFTLILFSFTEQRFLIFPIENYSLRWYGALFDNRDFWDADGVRHRKGTVIEVSVEEALDGVESGALSRVR